MADSDQKEIQVANSEDSDSVKALLGLIETLGDSLSAADRAKYEGLVERARESSNA